MQLLKSAQVGQNDFSFNLNFSKLVISKGRINILTDLKVKILIVFAFNVFLSCEKVIMKNNVIHL